MLLNKKIKGFTIMELLVSMTLTGILVAFAFLGYNQIHKLFINYTQQSRFILDYNRLNKALCILSDRSQQIEKTGEYSISFKNDLNTTVLNMNEKTIVLKFQSHTDTFHVVSKDRQFHFVQLHNSMPSSLIISFECDVFFQSQKFHVSFSKHYDSSSILKSTLELLPPHEFN